MYRVELCARGRRACHVEGMSAREAARVFGVDRRTVAKMLAYAVPPGYRRNKPRARARSLHRRHRPDPQEDGSGPRKQRHTAKRIFDRPREEYGFAGGYTIVKDDVQEG